MIPHKKGIDFDEIFSLMVKTAPIHVILGFTVNKWMWRLHFFMETYVKKYT